MSKTYAIKTFGCQMNEHDSIKIGGLLAPMGYLPSNNPDTADLILFNTCTIRDRAHHKAFSEIGIAAQKKQTQTKKPLIGVCGCVAQEEGAALIHRFPEVNLVFGPDQIHQLPRLINWVETEKKPAIATELINNSEDYEFIDTVDTLRLKGPTAFVTIMKGCNSVCTYCIVPQVRGKEVCRRPKEILQEVQALVARGTREVTLLGQTVNSYEGFSELLRMIAEETEVARIRFTSPHPKDVKEDLVCEYAENKKLCPHIHLPIQSGADRILRKMKRSYSRKQYLEKVRLLRDARPGIAITTDIIVGFPGETHADFEETLSLLDEVQYDNIFAFKYSPRPKTEAWEMKDDVPKEEKEERLDQLLKKQRIISKKINDTLKEKTVEVLVEGEDRLRRGLLSGRTDTNKIVNFTSPQPCVGDIVGVEVVKTFSNSLEGRYAGKIDLGRNEGDRAHH